MSAGSAGSPFWSITCPRCTGEMKIIAMLRLQKDGKQEDTITPAYILRSLYTTFSVSKLGQIVKKFLEFWVSTQHASRAGNQGVNLLIRQTE